MILLLNGTINSGKSTISQLLQEQLPNTAVVEIDSLRAFVSWMPLEQAIPLNLKNAVSVINNFVAEGLNVIVPYPLSQQNYDFLMEHLEADPARIHAITLSPRLETVLQDRGNRPLTEWETQRIQHHYQSGMNTPAFGQIIDNSEQTPQETVQQILQLIEA